MPTLSLIRHAIFSQAGPPQLVYCLPRYGIIDGKCLSQGHNNTLPVHEPNREWTALFANLRFYPLSCIAPVAGILAVSVFRKDTTVRYAKCGHRTSNLTITI